MSMAYELLHPHSSSIKPSSSSKKDLICMLYAYDYNQDKKLARNNQDPDMLRSKFFNLVSKDRMITKDYRSMSVPLLSGQDNDEVYDFGANHYVGGALLDHGKFPEQEPINPFSEGPTLKFAINEEILLFVNYNKESVLGEKNGEEVKGRFSIVLTSIDYDTTMSEDHLYWSDQIHYSDILHLFNKYPSIISALCEHEEIGPQTILTFLKFQ